MKQKFPKLASAAFSARAFACEGEGHSNVSQPSSDSSGRPHTHTTRCQAASIPSPTSESLASVPGTSRFHSTE